LLASVSFVTASPLPGLAAASLLLVAAIVRVIPPVGQLEATREVDTVRTVEGGDASSTVQAGGVLRIPGILVVDDEPPDIAEIHDPGRLTYLGVGRFSLSGDTEFTLPVRGVAHVGPLTVRAADPLGLSGQRLEARSPDSIHVWPKSDPMDEQPLRARYERMLSGRHNVVNPGESLEFYGIREYQPSDPMRKVNWNQTASQGELFVNEYEQETYGEVALFVDIRRVTGLGTHRENPLNEVCRYAATIGNIAYSVQDVLRAYAFGPPDYERFTKDPGSPWKDQFNDWLTELEPEGETNAEIVFDEVVPYLTERSIVVFITPLIGANVIGEAAHRALALENDVLVLVTDIPDSLPDPLQESYDDERQRRLDNLRDRGIPALDASGEGTLEQQLTDQEAMT
jgi:uncharacterized protein (DUF58 family)